MQHFRFSNAAKLLFFSLALSLAEPHAGADSDQRWRQTVGLPLSFPACLCLSRSVIKRPVAHRCGLLTPPTVRHCCQDG